MVSRTPFFPVLAGLAAGATMLFLNGTLLAALNWTVPLDWSLPLLLFSHRSAGMDVAMSAITGLGSAQFLLPASVAAAVLLYLRRTPQRLSMLLAALLAWGVLNHPMKLFFERARPDMAMALVHESSASFPSGHTLGAALILPALFMAITGRSRPPAVTLLPITLVAISRIYLGAHWPSDVLASLLAALVFWVAVLYGRSEPALRVNSVLPIKKRR
ncbi:phosphatase PAP2 family protein [Heliobacterium gestii]|uniref:Phosphatase PAP2 family protein n=1 Tax=Heliomicrobium gestii TaxID=2699 RepID=A0A845LBZ8_HELGE|nr:phosphatase PAP2 family protein [Heliomicrobium gestii]MBM7868137.1 undecaprenyl-diphosphatase [Heliomicrobium gestii]MZP44337.1 phosphatase PAP2 family protein [Heliomicrobium gestii]